MTDPFDTVREALVEYVVPPVGQLFHDSDAAFSALAALTEIEERLREETRIHIAESARANAEKNRADKAEAERDEARARLKLAVKLQERTTTAEQRVAELEAVVRDAADLLEGA